MKQCLLLLFLAVTTGRPAYGQYLFLDVNGDGHNALNYAEPGFGGGECLSPSITQVDVYFDTNHQPDGSAATCDQTAENALSMNSYEILLHADVHFCSVTFNSWTDNLGYTTGIISKGDTKFFALGTDVWVGLSGSLLPPGRYKVGTLNVTVSGGLPTVWFLPRGGSGINANAGTSFGTQCEGNDFDNTYTLGLDFPSWNAFGTCFPDAVQELTWGEIKQRYR